MRLVIDTSALLCVLLNQGPKKEIVEKTQGATLIAPGSLHWEIGNALSSLLKRKRISPIEARKVVDGYLEIPIQFVEIDLRSTVDLAGKHAIYAYDAFIIECAMQYRLPLLSLDRGLLEAARQEKVRIVEV